MVKKLSLAVLLLCLLATVPVHAETRCPCGCGCNYCCENYYKQTQAPHGYWTSDGYFCIPSGYYTTSGKYISAGYYPRGELPDEALGNTANTATCQHNNQQPPAYYPSAPVVKPDKVETKETKTSVQTNTTFSVAFPDGVDTQIVYVQGVGTVLANRNGTFQILN